MNELDIYKLKTAPADLGKLSNVVKKDVFKGLYMINS